MDDARPADPVTRWPRYEAAALGFRNYWYPVLESRKLRRRPRAVTLCGDKIVLVRERGAVHALKDRCPHRGVPLSAGRREFAGCITCRYHGWTFDLASGELMAALTDGPDSPICGQREVRVRTYPCVERARMIWIYPGDAPPPPIEDDLPGDLLAPDAVVEPMVEERPGDWRYAMENAVDEAHAKYAHRGTPFLLFRRSPGYQTDTRMVPSEDGQWLHRRSKPVFEPALYPRLGRRWPKHDFWRTAGKHAVVTGARLPSTYYVKHKDWQDYQIFVPTSAGRHLTIQVSFKRTRGLDALLWRLRFWTYIRLVHHIMLNRWEDGFIVANMSSPPEVLFRPDVSITAWRRWCEERARPQ
jgi:phenylpropionate dioxygenase-like ring-hydroxylating dioxygenase large terminal subunit